MKYGFVRFSWRQIYILLSYKSCQKGIKKSFRHVLQGKGSFHIPCLIKNIAYFTQTHETTISKKRFNEDPSILVFKIF